MSKSEAETVRDRAINEGCKADIRRQPGGSWRVYLGKDGHWTFVLDMDDLAEAIAFLDSGWREHCDVPDY